MQSAVMQGDGQIKRRKPGLRLGAGLCIALLAYALICTLPSSGKHHPYQSTGTKHSQSMFGCELEWVSGQDGGDLQVQPIQAVYLEMFHPLLGIAAVSIVSPTVWEPPIRIWQSASLYEQRVLLLT